MTDSIPVIVHAGLPKTGTTTIQATLFKNLDRLAAAGIFMPVFAKTMPGHRKLAGLWRETPNDLDSLSRQDLLGALRASIEQARAANGAVVLSSETLSDPNAGSGAKILPRVIREAGGEMRVLAYARPPIDHLPSSVQQESKAYRAKYSPISTRILMHVNRFENLKEVFGDDRIALRMFDRAVLVGGDVVTDLVDFCRTAGAPFPDLEPAQVANESLSGRACALLLTLRDALLERGGGDPARAFSNVRRHLVRFEAETDEERGGKLQIPIDWIPALEAIVARPWNRLLENVAIDAGDRARFRIAERPASEPKVELNRSEWLLSYRDRVFEDRFLAFYREQPKARVRDLPALLHTA